MKKIMFSFVLLIISVGLIAACGNDTSSSDSNDKSEKEITKVSFSTATTSGTWYPLGAAMAKEWNDNSDLVEVSSSSSDGSLHNLNLMLEGDVDMAFSTSDVLNDAYFGEKDFEGRAFKNVRTLGSAHPNAVYFVARGDSGVDDISDFKGKVFVPGAPSSSNRVTAEAILEAYGLTTNDFIPEYVDYQEALNLMQNKRVDGTDFQGGMPASIVTEAISTTDARILEVSDEAIQRLRENFPTYYEMTIPGGTYENHDEDIQTIYQPNLIVVTEEMPEEIAYELTKVLWENIDAIHEGMPSVKGFDLESATENLGEIPLHPGAEKFYREKGLID